MVIEKNAQSIVDRKENQFRNYKYSKQYKKPYEQHQEKTSSISRPCDEKGKARAFVDNRKDRRKKKQRSSKNKNTRRYQSINQFILLRINYIHTSHQKSRYLERVYIQYNSPMLPQGRRKQTVTPYNTMQDHIKRLCSTLHKNMYACFLNKNLHVGKSRVTNMRLALQSLGRKVIFLKTLLYATHNFRNDSER